MISKGGIGLRTTLFTGALAGMMLHGSVAFAQEAPRKDHEQEARALYNDGMDLAKRGDCKSAVGRFQRSMRSLPNKGSLYNLAICYNKLGRYRQAMSALLQLVQEFDADLRADMRASAKAEMKALKKRFAWVTIKTGQAGADVLVDGQSQGKTPLDAAIPLEKKPQTIAVSLKGYKTWVKEVDYTSGGEETFVVSLAPADGRLTLSGMDGLAVTIDGQSVGVTPLPSPIDLPPGEHRVLVTHSSIEPIEQVARVESGELIMLVVDKGKMVRKTDGKEPDSPAAAASETLSGQRLFRWGGIAAAGVGAAGIIGGVIAGSMAIGLDKDLSGKCPDNECPEDVDYTSDEQKMNSLGTASTALITAGGVIAAAGVTLMVLSYKLDFAEGEQVGFLEGEQVGFLPALSPDSMGAALRYSF